MAASSTNRRTTPKKKVYRKGVVCGHCRVPRSFKYIKPFWSCIVCLTEELEDNGDLSPSPWLFLDYGVSMIDLLQRRATCV